MSDADDRDLAAEIDELRARQEWAEESILALADAVKRLADGATPSTLTQTTRQMFSSRLDSLRGRGQPQRPEE